MLRLPALLTALILPLPLWAADCPTRGDLSSGGIAFGVDDSDTEIFHQKRPGLIESLYAYEGDTQNASRAMLAQGLFVLELVELENGDPVPDLRSTYGFPVAGAELPVPQADMPAGTGWTFTVAYNHAGDLGTETQIYTLQPGFEKRYGDCSYEVIPIELRYLTGAGEGPGADRDELHYLPALGLSYLARSTFDGSEDIYNYHSIRTLN